MRRDNSSAWLQVLGLPAMPAGWDEAKLAWQDVPNLKPLAEASEVNATRSNFIRCGWRA